MPKEENICPQCRSPYAYPDGHLLICPECGHEWSPEADSSESSCDSGQFADAHGTL